MLDQDTEMANFISDLTNEYRERVESATDQYYTEEFFDEIGGPRAVIETQFPAIAWREYFIGTFPTNRQAHLVYERGEPYGRDRDVLLGLNKQIRDEVKHARIFASACRRFDSGFDLATWEAESHEKLVGQCRAAVEWDAPQQIASGFQCSTEIMAAHKIRKIKEYIAPAYPEIATSLESVITDEGDHVHVGRLIMKRFGSPDEIDELREIAERKYDAAMEAMVSTVEESYSR